MSGAARIVGLEPDGDGLLWVLSPGIGLWCRIPRSGSWLAPGAGVGELRCLQRRSRLILPDTASGRIAEGLPRARAVHVEHGQRLFRMASLSVPTGADAPPELAVQRGAGDLPTGTRAIVAPTDGVFYARPSPDAPPFVSVGARVERGHPVGLVEVMKTFNQIVYDGPGWPSHAEVVETRVADGEEVRAGQILVVVR